MVKLYTLENCPRCKTLKDKLDMACVEYEKVTNTDEIIKAGLANALFPVLEVDGVQMNFKASMKWILNKERTNA